MTLDSKSEASGRPARGAVVLAMRSTVRTPAQFRQTSKERPPRGGAGRALAGCAGRVLRPGVKAAGCPFQNARLLRRAEDVPLARMGAGRAPAAGRAGRVRRPGVAFRHGSMAA